MTIGAIGVSVAGGLATSAISSAMASSGDNATTSKTGTTNSSGTTTYDTGPWNEQTGYLTDAFNQAASTYDNGMSNYYDMMSLGIPQSATANQWQLDSASQLANYASGEMSNPYALQDEYNSIAERENAQYDAYTGMAQELYGRGVDDLVAGANTVANSDYMNNAVNSAWTNANKYFNLERDGAGGINQQASRSGNLNSSRAGVAEGLAQAEGSRMGMEAENNLRYNAYNTGLQTALSERGYDQDVMNSIKTGVSYAGVEGQTANDERMANLYSLYSGAGDAQQGYEQTNADNLYNAYAMATDDPWSNLQNYYGIVGGNNWGQSGTSSTDATETSTSEQETDDGSTWVSTLGNYFLNSGNNSVKKTK